MTHQRGQALRAACLSLGLLTAVGCGSDESNPTYLELGETAIVVLANPVVNDVTTATIPAPGDTQAGIEATLDTGVTASTGLDGVAVLVPVAGGTRTISLGGVDVAGSVMVTIGDGDLVEMAIAADGDGAEPMAVVDYDLSGVVVELTPATPLAEVNAALAMSNAIVFFDGGTYEGDLEITGSNVTLFGEGRFGDAVTIDGDVTVRGSNNRIRGAIIAGALTIEGSDASVTFSRVLGDTRVSGSASRLLANVFCSGIDVSGSDATALDNAGLAPLPASCP